MAVAHVVEQQMQKLREETQLHVSGFDRLLQPITNTRDALWAGQNGMCRNAKSLCTL